MKDPNRFAEAFAFWVEHANPKRYGDLIDGLLPSRLGRVLDIGCGPGYLALHLAPRSTHVTGLDLSPAMIRIARRYREDESCSNVDFVVADAHHVPFPPASFDLVVSDTTLHDTEIAVTLPIIRDLVKPGGHLLLRDIITYHRKRSNSVAWQLLGTLRSVPRYLRNSGLATTTKLLRFEAGREWIRHRVEGSELTPADFRSVYGRELSGCDLIHQGWFMTAFWTAPAVPGDQTPAPQRPV